MAPITKVEYREATLQLDNDRGGELDVLTANLTGPMILHAIS